MNDINWEEQIQKAREESENTSEIEKEIPDHEFFSAPEHSEDSYPETNTSDGKGFDTVEVSEEEIEKVINDTPSKPEVKIVDIPDISEYHSYTTEDLDILSEKLNEKVDIPAEELSAILDNKDEHLTKLSKIIVNSTKRAEFERKFLEDLKDKIDYLPDLISDKMTKGKTFDKDNKLVTGNDAKVNISARLHGLRKINLVHSGFFIVTKKLTPSEIRAILHYVDQEEKEIGRILGTHYYSIDDVIIIQKMTELFKYIVVDSNLVNWKNDLLKTMSILDYDLVIGSLVAHLFKNGVKHEMVCPEIDCKYSELVNLDITKTKLIDMSRLNEKALKILLDNKPFDIIKFKAYQKLIGASKTIDVTDQAKFFLKVPTVATFVSYGIEYIAKLITALYSDNRTPTQRDIIEYRMLNYYKMFLPWIEKLTYYNEDGTEDFSTTEPEAWETLLEKDVWENQANVKDFTNFFTETKLVHYGFMGQECPVCKRTPNPKTNGFVPLDIRSFFFNLLMFQNLKDLKSSRTIPKS